MTSSVHCKLNCSDHAAGCVLIGQSGEKRCERCKSAKDSFSSDVVLVARSIRSHMTQLDTRRW